MIRHVNTYREDGFEASLTPDQLKCLRRSEELYQEFLAQKIEHEFWSASCPPGCGTNTWICGHGHHLIPGSPADDGMQASVEENTEAVTVEKPKPPSNPFYPKSRNPE